MDNKPSKDEDIEFLRDIKEDVAKKLPEYEVGYCKPPTHTQFKKGVSGNPAGRKKKVQPKSFNESMILELASEVSCKNDNGVVVKMPKMQILCRKIVQDAILKDGMSRKFILNDYNKFDLISAANSIKKKAEEEPIEPEPILDDERRMKLINMVERMIIEQEEAELNESERDELIRLREWYKNQNSLNENN